jgi:hypothetical protein
MAKSRRSLFTLSPYLPADLLTQAPSRYLLCSIRSLVRPFLSFLSCFFCFFVCLVWWLFMPVLTFSNNIDFDYTCIEMWMMHFAEALKGLQALNNRWFGGRVIRADLYSEERFNAGEFTG